ncbi:MAG: 1-phosphofructokinase [Clostridiales bacterium]|nr:1-phosphofructokinase [Clostridiales bacterium]
MIYTVTLNPSLDYIVSVEHFQAGIVNRTYQEKILPGGKGINVSTVLKNLGVDNVALGFTAGFTGDEILKRLKEFKLQADFIPVKEGMSRINVKLRSDEETEINGMGPKVTKEELEQLYQKLDRLKDGDFLVLAGNIPEGLPKSMYMSILERVKEKKLQIVVDATKGILVSALAYHPFLIKPNNHELQEIFDAEIKTQADTCFYAKKLQEMGARNVLVSLAGDGAVLLTEDGEVLIGSAPKGKLVNSVGAGDSMVAGFLTGYLETGDYKEAFKMGISAGSASAFSEELATRKEVEVILRSHHFSME